MVDCNDGVTYLAASHASPAIAQAVGGGAPAVGGASAVLGPRCWWSKQLKRKVCDGDGLELGGLGEAPAAAPGAGALVIHEARAADAAPEEVAPPALGWRPWKDKKAGKPRARPAATDLDAGPGARPAQASAPADAAAATAAAGEEVLPQGCSPLFLQTPPQMPRHGPTLAPEPPPEPEPEPRPTSGATLRLPLPPP